MKTVRVPVIVVILLLLLVSTIATGISFSDFHDGKQIEPYCTEPIVLVTGFEPFGSHEINPSQLIAETLDGQKVDGAQIVGIVLPVDFNDSVATATQTIEDVDPVIVISIGLAAHIRSIHVEKLGINLKRDPDDVGNKSGFRRITPFGPFFEVSSLPTRRIIQETRKAGIPARQSYFAGTYVCNALLYEVLSYITKNDLSIKAGFIHIPLLSSQDVHGMKLEAMLEATKIAIKVSLQDL